VNTQEIAVLLRVLRSVWPKTELNPDTVQAYEWALDDVPFHDGERAVKVWIRTGKFFPKPAELREIVSKAALGENEIAESAWVEVQREIKRVGFNRPRIFTGGRFLEPPTRAFSSPLIEQAVASVGWDILCTADDVSKVREQFLWTYRAIRQRDLATFQRGEIEQGMALPGGAPVKEIA